MACPLATDALVVAALVSPALRRLCPFLLDHTR